MTCNNCYIFHCLTFLVFKFLILCKFSVQCTGLQNFTFELKKKLVALLIFVKGLCIAFRIVIWKRINEYFFEINWGTWEGTMVQINFHAVMLQQDCYPLARVTKLQFDRLKSITGEIWKLVEDIADRNW